MAEMTLCGKAPAGWQCEEDAGHDGPCCALPASEFCPEHSTDPTYRAVANNRRLLGYEPQPCTCEEESA